MSAATYPKPKPTMRDGTLNQPPSFFFFSVRGCASLWSSSTGMSAIATLLIMSVLEDYGATAPVLGSETPSSSNVSVGHQRIAPRSCAAVRHGLVRCSPKWDESEP